MKKTTQISLILVTVIGCSQETVRSAPNPLPVARNGAEANPWEERSSETGEIASQEVVSTSESLASSSESEVSQSSAHSVSSQAASTISSSGNQSSVAASSVSKPVSGDNLNSLFLETAAELLAKDAKLGYSLSGEEGQHTRDLFYNGSKVFAVGNKKSHCVGATFQIFVTALSKYYEKTKDARTWSMPTNYVKWTPFKNCWYVNSGCTGARDALVKYGVGVKIDAFEKLRPGDFVNYDRSSGSGHSVMFLAFMKKGGIETTSYSADVIGFTYFSSQGSTGGMAKVKATFSDFSCTGGDCGILRKSLVMGRASHPKDFVKKTSSAVSLTGEDELTSSGDAMENILEDIAPEGSVPEKYLLGNQ